MMQASCDWLRVQRLHMNIDGCSSVTHVLLCCSVRVCQTAVPQLDTLAHGSCIVADVCQSVVPNLDMCGHVGS